MVRKLAKGKLEKNGEVIDVVVPFEDVIFFSVNGELQSFVKRKKYKLWKCSEKECIRYIEDSIGRNCPNGEHLRRMN